MASSMLTVSVAVNGLSVQIPQVNREIGIRLLPSSTLINYQEVTFLVPLTEGLHRMKPTSQTLAIDISAQDTAQSYVHVETRVHISKPLLFPDRNARLRYETLKTMASAYDSNLRSLEEHWRTVFAELFRAILPGHIIVQEEGTLWTFHDTTRNPAAALLPLNRTMPLGSGSGYSMRPDFRAIVSRAGRIHFPILGECKKAISRQHASPSGWPATGHGRAAFISSLRHAVNQVELQAVVLFKLDRDSQEMATRQSTVCLVAAVGPIYVMTLVTREQIESAYPDANLEEVNDQIRILEQQEELERARDAVSISPDAMQNS
ncbi:hypothetical protein B0H17DRAFT_1110902 [Mycena rosella]|uniref:Uncharacterized protein n=1 Tax=Mycena rosella TaxID=1033263 RepID=A0AAD7BNV0_MYCRO|nr:hypothetical protein B0H17DRAFT_1110902 [Mycena rosella]